MAGEQELHQRVVGVESRQDKLEDYMRSLTKQTISVTKDVDRLIKTQNESTKMLKTQAVQENEMLHMRESMGRWFARVESLESDIRQVIIQQAADKSKDDTRVGIFKGIMRYWHIIVFIGLLSASGGYFIK